MRHITDYRCRRCETLLMTTMPLFVEVAEESELEETLCEKCMTPEKKQAHKEEFWAWCRKFGL